MLIGFFFALRAGGVPVGLDEWLTLMGALDAGLAFGSVDDFYHLSRTALVKDESRIDRFDRVFASYFKGLAITEDPEREIPADWLKRMAERYLTPEELAKVKALGGWDKLIETLKQRLAEQKSRHSGGSKWIGTGGTSPFGAYGYNPEGIRIGQDESRHRRAVKVWDKREFQDLDGDEALGPRAMKLALRRLRRFARTGAPTELDMPGTIRSTAAKGGLLDLHMVPERHNAVKVLLLLDIGGSMDDHVEASAQLFAAARSEFKHLDFFYFHNCPYERLWKDNRRRHAETVPTTQILNTYPRDTKLVLVGDATMSPYEITQPGASVEHWNEESGAIWMSRLLQRWPKAAWLNPKPEPFWSYTPSLELIRRMMAGRMYGLTATGIDQAMRDLVK